MPRFNVRGDLCIGLGRDWFDLSRTIAQECNTLRPGCVVALSDGTIVAETGTNQIVANGRRAWAFVPFPGPVLTVDSFGRTIPDRAPQTIGPDGSICLRPHSNAFADVIDRDSAIWRLADTDVFDVQLLDQRRAIWRERRNPQPLFSRGIAVEQPAGGYGWARLIWIGDRFALLYQSFDGGALVFDGRIIAKGIAFYRPDAIVLDGVLHVAWSTQEHEPDATRLSIPLSQLSTLPKVGEIVPTPPAPVPPTNPEPPPMPELPNLKADLEAERAKYPALLTHDQPAKILNAVAWKHRDSGAGLSVKRTGNRVPSPQGVDVAYDIIHFRDSNRLFDCLTGDLAGIVTWGETTYHGDPVGRPWLAPIQPDPVVIVPAPDPPIPAPPADLAAILARLDLMDNRAAIAQAETVAALKAVAEAVAAFKGEPAVFPNYQSNRLALIGTITLKPVKP